MFGHGCCYLFITLYNNPSTHMSSCLLFPMWNRRFAFPTLFNILMSFSTENCVRCLYTQYFFFMNVSYQSCLLRHFLAGKHFCCDEHHLFCEQHHCLSCPLQQFGQALSMPAFFFGQSVPCHKFARIVE